MYYTLFRISGVFLIIAGTVEATAGEWMFAVLIMTIGILTYIIAHILEQSNILIVRVEKLSVCIRKQNKEIKGEMSLLLQRVNDEGS